MSNGYGLLRSLTKEAQEPVETSLKGKIPDWVSGTLFRNGGGRYEFGDKKHTHLFDGHSCIHKFKIVDGKVFYSNKFLQTNCHTKTLAENRLYQVFGTADPCETLFSRLKSLYVKPDTSTYDNTNVNVMPFGNCQLYALTETKYINRLNPTDLSIMNTYDVTTFADTAASTFAHPHVLNDGSWYTMGRSTRSGPGYKVVGTIPSSMSGGLSYFHSFGLSENFIIYCETALKIHVSSLISNVLFNRPILDAFHMDKTWPTRIHVLNRHTGELHTNRFVTEPMFIFHHINAYEKPTTGEIVVDVCAYEAEHFELAKLTGDRLFTGALDGTKTFRAIARRITLPIGLPKTDKEIFCEVNDINAEIPFEFPIINYATHNTKPYRYAYGANVAKKPYSVVKLDVDNGRDVVVIDYTQDQDGHDYLPAEPVFVPNPNGMSEDDGVLLVMVLSDKNDFLSVLDARDLREIARADVPAHVKGSYTFHGFFADSQMFPILNL